MPAQTASQHPTSHRALVGWRLLALCYDIWPVLALWMAVSTIFTLGYTFLGHHPTRQNIPPFSLLQWLLWLSCWAVTGAYATISWRHGGQTLGMRPWRITLIGCDDTPRPEWKALWIRYCVGTLSLLCGGLGFWWAWFDPLGLTWHDRVSRTRLVRSPKKNH